MTKWYVWADLFLGIWENGAAVRSFGSNILIMHSMSLALTHSHRRTAACLLCSKQLRSLLYAHKSDEIWLPNSCFCLFYWVLNNHVRQCFGSTPHEMACNHLKY